MNGLDLLARAPVATLATTDDDGRPNLVPIVFALLESTLYSAVDHKPKRTRRLRRFENVGKRPAVTLLVHHYEDDWTNLWWVRLRGRARIVEDPEEERRAIALLVARYPAYERRPPLPPVLAVTIDETLAWEAALPS